MKKSSLILVKTFQGADRTPGQPPAYILHFTVAILFYNYSSTLISRTILRSFNTIDGATDSSSSPMRTNSSVRVVSAP